jgi:hypothetical protein
LGRQKELKFYDGMPITETVPVFPAKITAFMSSLGSVSSSSGVDYATQLAQSSSLERSLYNLGSAVESGDLTSAGSILTALIQANPQYATSATSGGSSGSQSPINQDFQNLASAISSNSPDTAKNAWAQLKSDLAKAGVKHISSGTELAAQTLAENKLSMEQSLLTGLFGAGSGSGSSLATLLGGSSGSAATADPVAAAVSNWLTYQADGSTSAAAVTSPDANSLDVLA